MQRVYQCLVVVLLTSMGFGSCTCHQEPPPQAEKLQVTRKPGFAASLPTARKREAESNDIVLEKHEPTFQPTLPPAPTPPASGEIAMPDDFPQDVPVFENAKPFHVQQLPQNARSVLFKSDGQTKDIYDFYHSKMPAQGWNVAQEYQAKEQSFLSFKKGNMITNMTISKDPKTGKQIIGIMYYEEKPLPFPEF
jgi:hypothetical protein